MLRAVLLAVSAAASGLAYGRKAAGRTVARKTEEAIEEAAAQTRAEISGRAEEFVLTQSKSAARKLLLRVAIVGLLIGAYLGLGLPREVTLLVIGATLSAMLIRDVVAALPTTKMVMAELRRYDWRPRRALREVIARQVFERVLAEAGSQHIDRKGKAILSVTGHTQEGLARLVAARVAEIARDTHWGDIRPYLIWGGITVFAFFAYYAAFVFVAVRFVLPTPV